MTRLRSHGPPLTQWLYCLVVLLRRKYSTNNMDQSKIPTIHCSSRSESFIHSAHFIELIEKHRDIFPWTGPFNPQDLTSNIRYHVPDLIFPATALIELTASEHLCPCLSERERRVWGLFCPHCHRCYRVTIVTEESYKVTMAAPVGLRDSVTTL